MRNRTAFVIAHRLSTVRRADAIVALERGRVAEIGRHEELLARPAGVYAKLYALADLRSAARCRRDVGRPGTRAPMIKSMTGFASLTRDERAATISVTIRAVNHRFLDVQLRTPPALAADRVAAARAGAADVARGRVEVAISVQARTGAAAVDIAVNDAVIEAPRRARSSARASAAWSSGALTPAICCGFPRRSRFASGRATDGDARALASAAEAALAAALDDLDRMRIAEGAHLRAELDSRRAQLGELFERAAAAAAGGRRGAARRGSPSACSELRADASVDEAAIAQEIVRFANRSDITEETVRFRATSSTGGRCPTAPEPCGRKLDFLLQEMNREVNTLGSKAEGTGVSEIVVALKAELEKMREQVQNVE